MKHIRNFALSVLILSMVLVMVPAQAFAVSSTASDYTDVKGSWCEKRVDLYGYKEVFSNGDSKFYPNQGITRMEFARLLHKALGININYFAAIDISEYYNDVTSKSVGASQLYDLVTCGIIDTKTSFRPNEVIKRDEMIHFVMNAFYYTVGNDYMFTQIYRMFEDDSDIKAEYSTDIQHACALGLINGIGNNYLFPRETATRAEAVTIAGRLAELKLTENVAVKSTATEQNGGLILSLTITNNTDKAIAINHSNQQMFDFVIFDKSGNELYRWSKGRMFSMVVISTKIEPGKEITFSDTVSAADYSLIKAKVASVKAYIVGTSSDFTINPDGYLITEIS